MEVKNYPSVFQDETFCAVAIDGKPCGARATRVVSASAQYPYTDRRERVRMARAETWLDCCESHLHAAESICREEIERKVRSSV